MENLLKFPQKTIIDRLIPKAQFVKVSSNPTALRNLLAEEFEQIRLLYILRPDTINVDEGNEVKEIDVFFFKCKEDCYSINPFCGIDDLIPRHTIYIVQYGKSTDLLIQHKRRSEIAGKVKWTREVSHLLRNVDLSSSPLQIEGLNLDSVYFNFLSQVSGYHIQNSETVSEIKGYEEQLSKLNREAQALQKRVRNEKQFNRQIEFNTQLREIKKKITELENRLAELKK